jgi:lipopolysaccharide heptosyltransferase II
MIVMRSRGKRAAALAVDAFLGALAPLIARHATEVIVPASPRVLVIRCDHIGDAVMASTVLRPLRDALNPARLDVLVGPWSAPLFEGHPAVDHVLCCAAPWWSAARGSSLSERAAQWAELPRVVQRIRANKYDIGIDLRGDLRQIALFLGIGGMPVRVSSDRTGGRALLTHVAAHDASLHEVEKGFAIAALLGATGSPRLDIVASSDRSDALSAILPPEMVTRGYAAFALRGSEENRAWLAPQAANVADRLFREFGLTGVYVGATTDRPFGDELANAARTPVINLAGRTSLAEALAVLRDASITIAVDSGPMHLAAAVGSPVVALFGSGNPADARPWSDNARVISVGAPCGCVHPRCDFTDGPGRCMRSIDVEMVMEAVRDIVTRSATAP